MRRLVILIAIAASLVTGVTAIAQSADLSPQEVAERCNNIQLRLRGTSHVPGLLLQARDLPATIKHDMAMIRAYQDRLDNDTQLQTAHAAVSGTTNAWVTAEIGKNLEQIKSWKGTLAADRELLAQVNQELRYLHSRQAELRCDEITTANSGGLSTERTGGTLTQGEGAELTFKVNDGQAVKGTWGKTTYVDVSMPIGPVTVIATTNGQLPAGFSMHVFRTTQKNAAGDYLDLCKINTGNECRGNGSAALGDPRYNVSEGVTAQVNAANGASVMAVQFNVTWTR